MKETFGAALGNTIVKNLAKNADVDPTKIAVGLVVTAAGTALTVVTKSVTRRVVAKAIRKSQQQKEKAQNEQKDIPEIQDRSSDED